MIQLSLSKTGYFHPAQVLEVIPRFMTTLVVLICDKGIHVSHRFCEGYFALHRLMLALV